MIGACEGLAEAENSLMGQLLNLLFGLLTILIGYMIGRVWQRAVDRLPLRKARALWGPVLSGHIQFVVGRFTLDNFVEPTGIVGGGDALALRELSSYFSKIGAPRLSAVYVSEASVDRDNNLILLGGPDTNKVTRDALDLIKPRIKIVNTEPGAAPEIHDLISVMANDDGTHTRQPNAYRAGEDVDYGIIIRTYNPFNPERGLIIIAGTYGYGTWGGVRLMIRDDFLKRCQELIAEPPSPTHRGHFDRLDILNTAIGRKKLAFWPQFECIFKVQVFDGRPYSPQIIVFRQLAARPNVDVNDPKLADL
jgi:hypothetical protein